MSIPFNKPFRSSLELKFLEEVLEIGSLYGCGKYSRLATKTISECLGKENILLTDSCSSALDIIGLWLRGTVTNPKANVILPSYTFSSTANAFAKSGFVLNFCDVGSKKMVVDLETIKSCVDENTCAIVLVHYGLNVCEIKKIRKYCDSEGYFLIEDAAQLFGASYQNVKVGTVGHFGVFSFHETKNLHCGLGGCLYYENNDDFDRLTAIWERGTNRQAKLKGLVDKYTWTEIGGSYYPTELQSAVLYSQLLELEENINEREKVYQNYLKCFKKYKFPELNIYYSKVEEDVTSNYHSMYLIFENTRIRDEVLFSLEKQDISAFIGYVPLHTSPQGQKLGAHKSRLKNTEIYSERILRLPYYVGLSRDEVESISEKVAIIVKRVLNSDE